MDEKKKKGFVPPEAEIIDLGDEDVITLSAPGAGGEMEGDDNFEIWGSWGV